MTETAKLTASDGLPGDHFGSAVSVSLNTIVVGDFETPSSTQGAAYIFSKPAKGWANMTETAKLTVAGGQGGDLFGIAVAANQGTTLVIGATQAGNSSGGAAYVFVEPKGGWKTTSKASAELTASDRGANQNFGQSVAVNGKTIVVGGKSSSGNGAAYVFVEPPSGWANATETAQLRNPLGQSTDCFSCSVGVSGSVIAVGSPQAGGGVVYVFHQPTSGWKTTQRPDAKLKPAVKRGSFGYSVGFDSLVAAGAPEGQGGGAGYVFGP